MRVKRVLSAGLAVVALVLPGTAANAATGSPDIPSEETIYLPMFVRGYDAQVAAAHGFEIVTDADGAQRSVPVTAEATAQDRLAQQMKADALTGTRALASPAADNDKWGDCGGSSIGAVKKANDQLAWTSSFTVFGAASGYSWNISAVGAITTNSWHMAGNGPATGHKSFEGGGTVIGPGYATVPIWSVVTMVNGAVCYSLGPIAWFG